MMRKMTLALFFFFFFFMLFANSFNSVVSEAPSYYILVLQWPNSICNNEDSLKIPCIPHYYPDSLFTLHGVWPKLPNGNDPNVQSPQPNFNAHNFQDLDYGLTLYWPNLIQKTGTNEAFWKYEWYRHGILSPMTQYQYFGCALNAAIFMSLASRLERESLKPSPKGIPFSVFKAAIYNQYSVKAQLKCNKDITGKYQQIAEVRFNVSFDPSFVITLDPHLKDHNGLDSDCDPTKDIYYPARI